MSFAAQIKAFEAKAKAAMNKSVSNAVESLFTEVVTLSPNPPGKAGYAKGLLKNSWYSDIGAPNLTVGTVANGSGVDSLSRIKATLAAMPFLGKDAVITLTNSTPYIRYVEYIGWPKGYPGNTTGWDWNGKTGPYSMASQSINNFKGRYQ